MATTAAFNSASNPSRRRVIKGMDSRSLHDLSVFFQVGTSETS
jgi:hypothetical protein